jgi:hypothetical protein
MFNYELYRIFNWQFFQPRYGPEVEWTSNRNEYKSKRRAASMQGSQPHRHLCIDCLENVGASTSHNAVGLQGLLQWQAYLFFILC